MGQRGTEDTAMPQGRSKAFSGKKKKLQMQQKRNRTPNSVTGETPSHVPKDTDEIGNSSIIIGTAAADRRALLSEDTVNLGARSGTSREVAVDIINLYFYTVY